MEEIPAQGKLRPDITCAKEIFGNFMRIILPVTALAVIVVCKRRKCRPSGPG
jgi:hypothetical protein